MQTIYLAGGCFWGTQEFFSLQTGVLETSVGYANGLTKTTNYQKVCRGEGRFAEAVKIIYDDSKISLEKILSFFLDVIDPFSFNKQGNDYGVQYRSGIYYCDVQSQQVAKQFINKLQAKHPNQRVMIEVAALDNFVEGEDYHQNYLKKNPSGYCHIGQDKMHDYNK